MRGGYIGNEALRKYVERGDSRARVIVEAVKTDAEDLKDVQGDWNSADATAGFLFPIEGGVRLSGSQEEHAANGNAAAVYLTGLGGPFDSPVDALVVEWVGSEVENQEIHTLRANLDSDYGGAQDVTHWYARMYRLARVERQDEETIWFLEERSGRIEVGASAGTNNVDFTFATNAHTPTVGGPPERGRDSEGDYIEDVPTLPTTVFILWALTGTGEAASNVCWNASNDLQVVDSSHTLSRHPLNAVSTAQSEEQGSRWSDDDRTAGVPICNIYGRLYSAQTITFSSGNLIDLGAAPGANSILEIVYEASVPGGTTTDPEINDGVGSGWVAVADGDRIGEDNSSRGGNDLSGVARQQTYQVRDELSPSLSSLVSPWVHRLGVREITSEDLDQLVEVTGYTQKVDPVTLKSNISEVQISILRDGITDYRDFGSYLLSEYYINEILFRLWYGHPDLARQHWLHLDDFVIDDPEMAKVGVDLTCVNVLGRLKRKIPIIDTGAGEREPLEYLESDAQTVGDVYDDLIGGQLGLAGRYIGPGIDGSAEPGSFVLAKKIKTARWAKEEIDRVASLADCAVISSQGRLKAVNFFDQRPSVAYFPYEMVKPISFKPGTNRRITDYFTPYGWDEDKDNGRGAYSDAKFGTASSNVLERLGRALIDEGNELDDETAKWITDSDHSLHIAQRQVSNFEVGVPVFVFEAIDSPNPHLEVGDAITVETDRIVLRDPNDDRALRGRLAVRSIIIGVFDKGGTRFAVWPQGYSDVIPDSISITHIGYADPRILDVQIAWADDGTPTFQFLTFEAGSVKAVGDDTAFQGRSTVRAQGANATDSEGYVSIEFTGDTYEVGETCFLSALSFENADATGSEQTLLTTLQFTRTLPDPQITAYPEVNSDRELSLTTFGNSAVASVRALANFVARGDPRDDPTESEVRLETAKNGQILTPADWGSLGTFAEDEVAYLGIFGYTEINAGGSETEPLLLIGPIDPDPPDNSIRTDAVRNGNIIAEHLIESARNHHSDIDFYAFSRTEARWLAGDLEFADGTTYSIVAGSITGLPTSPRDPQYVYFDPATSTTVLQTTSSLITATADGVVLLAVARAGFDATDDAMCIPAATPTRLAIDSAELNSDAVQASHILAGSVTTAKLDALAVTTAKLAAGAVEADKIAANAVTAAKIDVATLSAITADIGTVTAGTISSGIIVATGTLTAATIAMGAGNSRVRITGDTLTFGAYFALGNTGYLDMSSGELRLRNTEYSVGVGADISITTPSGSHVKIGDCQMTGEFTIVNATDDLGFLNASDTGGTEDGWISVDVGGTTRYIRLHSTS